MLFSSLGLVEMEGWICMREEIKSSRFNSRNWGSRYALVSYGSELEARNSKVSNWWTRIGNWRSNPLERSSKTLGGRFVNSTVIWIDWKWLAFEGSSAGREAKKKWMLLIYIW